MFDGILGSGRQNSIFRIIFVHFNIIFHSNLTNLALSGATQKLKKSLPCAENFFASLTDDIFIICNLKVSKNNRNTYRNMHFETKFQKNVLGTYIALYIVLYSVIFKASALWDIKSWYSKLSLYSSKNECARTDTVFFPISQVCTRGVTLLEIPYGLFRVFSPFLHNKHRLFG